MERAFDSGLDWADRLRAALSAGMEILAADERRARFYVSEVLRVDDRMRDRQSLAMERHRVRWNGPRLRPPRRWRYRLAE